MKTKLLETKKVSETQDQTSGKMLIKPQVYHKQEGVKTFSFKHFFIEYQRFHMDETNTAIHMIFIPIIVSSIFGLFLCCDWTHTLYLDLSKDTPSLKFLNTHPGKDSSIYELNLTIFIWSGISVIYIFCDVLLGICTYIFGLLTFAAAAYIYTLNTKTDSFLYDNVFAFFLAVFLFGWSTQFVGHGCYERRAPAILTNLLFMGIAPFFVCNEILNKFFGYKQGEIDEYLPTVEADIAHYRQTKGYPMRKGIEIIK